jgi:hypothetical protein
MRRKKRVIPPIDRVVPSVGRITLRTQRMTRAARDELDRAIVRAMESALLEPLQLLKKRQVLPVQFLEASRRGQLAALKAPSSAETLPPLRPLVEQWLKVRDLRESSRARYWQSWEFLFESLPPEPTLADLTVDWWSVFVESRREEVGNATLNRDRAAYLAFRAWAKVQKKPVIEFETQRFKEEPEQSRILTPEEIRRFAKPAARIVGPYCGHFSARVRAKARS